MIDETSSRASVLKAVKKNGLALKHASHELQQDLQIVAAAVKNNHKAMDYVAFEVLDNPANAFWLLESNYLAYTHFQEKWRENEAISLAALEICKSQRLPELKQHEAFEIIFQFIPKKFLNSTDFFIKALKSLNIVDPETIPDDRRWSKPFILACFKSERDIYFSLYNAPANFILDDDFVIELLKTKQPSAKRLLEKFSLGGELSSEYKLLDRIIDSVEAFKSCDKQDSKEFVKKALKANPLVFDYLSDKLKQDQEIFELASPEDRAIFLVQKDPDEFFKLDANLQANPKILGHALKFYYHMPDKKNTFLKKVNPQLWNNSKHVALVADIAGQVMLPDPALTVETYKECLKLKQDFNISCRSDLFSAKDIQELELCSIEHYPNSFKRLNKKFRTSKAFMEKAQALPVTKPFVDKFLEDHHLTCNQLILEEEQTEAIKASVDRAQRLYAAWYKPKTKETLESTRSKPGYSGFKLSSLTWFRHGQKGQERATNLKKAIASKDEWQIWQAIQSLLAKAPYHEHSFASFLIDELKKLESSPFANISFSKENHNRYSKKEVMFALKNFLAIRDPNFEEIILKPDSKFGLF